MSAWAATRHSERFRASVVAAGLTNWIAFAGTTDIPYEMSLVHWDSWWFDEPELHWERSPLAHVQKAHTPTLIVHGEKDDRVHPEQGLEMYTALRIKGVPTQYVVYIHHPGELLGERLLALRPRRCQTYSSLQVLARSSISDAPNQESRT